MAETNLLLTDREKLILCYLAKNKNHIEISDKMSVTKRTVKMQIQNIINQLNVKNQKAAVKKAINLGLTN